LGLTGALLREAIYLYSIARTLWLLRLVKPGATRSIVDIVEAQAKKRPGAVAIYYLDQAMSYAQLDARANRYAHWALSQGIGRGAAVALLMENRPDYICAWLGLFKAGAQVALINTNLTGAALAHSISISGTKHAIVGKELEANFLATPFEVRPALWVEGEGGNLSAALALRCARIPAHRRGSTFACAGADYVAENGGKAALLSVWPGRAGATQQSQEGQKPKRNPRSRHPSHAPPNRAALQR